jgi:hypothetical protein
MGKEHPCSLQRRIGGAADHQITMLVSRLRELAHCSCWSRRKCRHLREHRRSQCRRHSTELSIPSLQARHEKQRLLFFVEFLKQLHCWHCHKAARAEANWVALCGVHVGKSGKRGQYLFQSVEPTCAALVLTRIQPRTRTSKGGKTKEIPSCPWSECFSFQQLFPLSSQVSPPGTKKIRSNIELLCCRRRRRPTPPGWS